jgi:hypothetical protein
VRTFAAAAALLALLGTALPARADEEPTAAEIEARLGPPGARQFVPCRGQDPRDQARCVRWQYDQGTLHTAYLFDVRTGRLLEVTAWDEEAHWASSTSHLVGTVEPATRVATSP